MMRNCVLFPLLDEQGRLVSLYGRSIFDITGKKHYYSTGRRGLFPKYPDISTRHLVLTESIIDACSLLQHTACTALALYGTKGLTTEHQQAIKRLSALEEITLFLDGDQAGRNALAAVAKKLKAVTTARISYVETPENEDINSLTLSHEPQILDFLMGQRRTISIVASKCGEGSIQQGQKRGATRQNTPLMAT
ncbi:toprim domain-containing protein [Leadbetterella byssophila]|uniref:toprim domain-containing protein n=1 Tax=Leadbetterella byssophila TaxID=316068 RepID=UPI0005A22629|nr:toprim domain-containing protein [Leadbetterella byssophila]